MYSELKEAWTRLTAHGQPYEVERVLVRGIEVLSYVKAPLSLRDVWLDSAKFEASPYLVYEQERLSYAETHRQVGALARTLANRGVRPGDRVAIAMRNYPEWMIAYWAVTGMGAVVVGMNAWWVPDEMSYALGDSCPRVLITDRERLERFSEIRDQHSHVHVIGVRVGEGQPAWVEDWSGAVRGEVPLPEVDIDPDSDACIFYTSGTTGRPKGAQLTHRGCVNNIMNVAFMNSVQTLAMSLSDNEGSPVAGTYDGFSALVATPLFHVTANNCLAQVLTAGGGRLVFMYKWDAAEALRLIEKERITALSAVPLMTRELVMHRDFSERDTSSLRSIGGGGAPMQPDLVSKVVAMLPEARPSTGYGMTETCGVIAAAASRFLVDRPTSVGPTVPTLEAKCVDSEGRALPAHEVGEFLVRGAPVIRGYLNSPDASSETIVDGWLHTGDMAYMDDEGFVYLVDRAKDMVLRGGENVYCAEVENTLFDFAGVAECAVFAVPDERLGEAVGAAVYSPDPNALSIEALRAHCGSRLSAFKIPQYIWLINDPLPRNANGKFLKRELKARLDVRNAL